jgi:hypothetical protein
MKENCKTMITRAKGKPMRILGATKPFDVFLYLPDMGK